jgi:hypothetical protein
VPSGLVVACVKWGDKYPPHYVNRLRSAIGRNLAARHRFVCLTENFAGLGEGIETLPLPPGLSGYWNKISLFKDGMFPPGTTVLYLDLDVVIVGPLDFLLDDPGGFCVIRDWMTKSNAFNSSVVRFEAGAFGYIYDRFINDAAKIVASGRYIGDQDWIREQVGDTAKSFAAGRIASYKKDLASHVFPRARKLGLDFSFLRAPRFLTVAPPAGAAIVVFHGKPDPEDVMDAPYGPWKRAPFVKEYWR